MSISVRYFRLTTESNSTQNGKNIYCEGARSAKDVKKREFCFNTRFTSRSLRLRVSKVLVPGCPGRED
jgi:hypothetical protein